MSVARSALLPSRLFLTAIERSIPFLGKDFGLSYGQFPSIGV
ncbi:hypothetical protein [Microcystis sp. LEGE 08355]|nr:hypothetical protein [Microcystis sp. LEGE 08355]